MDTYSSGEELVIKARKPYTITKQRERWTEEEHNRFLEALKLHGRAWQRIEEHIGTKTAVQIRSHAQKFFSKLEKEAVSKGVPIGQSVDIDIPPPRPKRKPSNPYPRKSCGAAPSWSTSHGGVKDGKLVSSASSHCKQAVGLEKEPLDERPSGEEKNNYGKENKDDNYSEVFTLLSESHCSSVSSANKSSITAQAALRTACTFREFVPSVKKVMTRDVTNESYVTIELKGNQNLKKTDGKKIVQDNDTSEASKLVNTNAFKLVQGEKADDLNCALPKDEMQSTQNYPRNVPTHILDVSIGDGNQTTTPDLSLLFQDSVFNPVGKIHGQPNVFANPAESTTTTEHGQPQQSFPAIPPPFSPFHFIQENFRSFPHISSTFSSLIMSSLLQSPAAHAAASFAATYWPYRNAQNTGDSPACSAGDFSSSQMSSPPSMEAIAAATVAAATAWWAAHGLLPLCAPLQTSFSPVPMSGVSSMEKVQAPAAEREKGDNSFPVPSLQDQQPDPQLSEPVQAQHSPSKSPTMCTADSNNGGVKPNNELKAADNEKAIPTAEVPDSDKAKSRKQVDRSSCGSNTASSSEVETDALEKQERGEEELKEPDMNHQGSESSVRRTRSIGNMINMCNMSDSLKERHMNDSWKEVSEEGRVAFQALFSREVLPQSFSPPPDSKVKGIQETIEEAKHNAGEMDGKAPMLDLNSKAWSSFSQQESDKIASPVGLGDVDGLLTLGLGHGKLKARRTGFKPYKRCSVEANENRVANAGSHCEEKGPKRLRLEGEAST